MSLPGAPSYYTDKGRIGQGVRVSSYHTDECQGALQGRAHTSADVLGAMAEPGCDSPGKYALA